MDSIDNETIVLLQWRPTWAIQAFLRFENIPYKVENIAYPSNSMGNFPQLRDGNFIVSGEENIMVYLLNYLNTSNDNHNGSEGRKDTENRSDDVGPGRALLGLLFEDLPRLLNRAEALDHPDAKRQLASSFRAAVKASPSWIVGLFSAVTAGSGTQRVKKSSKVNESQVSADANDIYGQLLSILQNDKEPLSPHVLSLVKACVFGHVAEALLLPCLNHALLVQVSLIESFMSTYEVCFVAGLKHGMKRFSADDANGCNPLGNLPTALSVARWGVRLDEDSVIKYNKKNSNNGSWLNVLLVALPVFSLSFFMHHHHQHK
jgi:hypothetical protein